jgi:translation initiation factor IF-1
MAKKNRGGNRRSRKPQTEKIERDDRIVLEGEVLEALPGTFFKVGLPNGLEILATLAGKMRQFRIRILPGDQVTVEVSPYDMSRGRITWRHRT